MFNITINSIGIIRDTLDFFWTFFLCRVKVDKIHFVSFVKWRGVRCVRERLIYERKQLQTLREKGEKKSL